MGENLQQAIVREIELLLAPIIAVSQSELRLAELFARIGWDVDSISGFPADKLGVALGAIASASQQLAQFVEQPPDSLEDFWNALNSVKDAIEAIRDLDNLMGGAGARPPELDRLGSDLIDLLVVTYLDALHPLAYRIGVLLKLITPPEDVPLTAAVFDPSTSYIVRYPHARSLIHLDRIGELLTDPVGMLKSHYLGPNGLASAADAKAVADILFPAVAASVSALGVDALYGTKPAYGFDFGPAGNEFAAGMLTLYWLLYFDDDTGEEIGVGATFALSPSDRGGLGLVIVPFGELSVSRGMGQWDLDLKVTAGVEGFAVGSHGFTLHSQSGIDRVDALFAATKLSDDETPAFIIGGKASSRLEIGSFRITAEGALDSTRQDFGFLAEAGKSAIVVDPGEGDGFLQKILPSDGFRTAFDLAIGWSKSRGVYFRGSAGLEVTLPVHIDLFGALKIDSIFVALRSDDGPPPGLDAVVAATARLKLGPITATVDRMGLRAIFTFPPDGGNLGPVNLEPRFKSPDGAGLAIDAAMVVGSGYLFRDEAKGQYGGYLQLSIKETLSFTVIGLLTTPLPGQRDGFALLIIIAVTFPPIQLGFGFTLNGLGGLAGVNRTIVIEALQAGVRNRAIDHILFPPVPIPDPPRLVSDLSTFFPPANGRYVFGPMAILGWGTPPVVEAELAIILELPAPVRLLILGQIHIALPQQGKKETVVAELHLDILGVIDFGGKHMGLDGTLHDSRIVVFDIFGDMAMRLTWGEQPNFTLAIGGFNPHFQPPPAFPELRRLTLALGTVKNPRLSLEAYLAVTSNTFQVGARADVYAEKGAFNISGWAGFDALFVFDPFSFLVDISAAMALKRQQKNIAEVYLDAHLSGPAPWHAWGNACLDTFLGNVCVELDVTFGEPASPSPLPPVEIWTLLEPAIRDRRNWSGELPPAGARVVSLILPPGANASDLIDPLGRATLRQKVVPLNQRISKFGEATVIGDDRFDLDLTPNDGRAIVKDFYPTAWYDIDLSDGEKLSLPSFEKLPAGITVGIDADVLSTTAFTKEVTFKTIVINDLERPWDRLPDEISIPLLVTDQLAQVARGASGTAALFHTGLEAYSAGPTAPQEVTLADEDFMVVSTDTLELIPDLDEGMTKGEAYRALKAYLASNPQARGTLQVVPVTELAT